MSQSLRRFLPLIVLGVIALGGGLWYVLSNPGTLKAPTTTTEVPAEPTKITEDATYYTVDAAFPSATPLKKSAGAVADKAAVDFMHGFVMGQIDSFKKNSDFENLSHDDIQMLHLDERKYAIGIEYEMKESGRTITYIFQVYTDTGGAHPNTTYRTITFDRKTGRPLTTADLFAPGAQYLATLSALARAKLPAIIAAREEVSVSEVQMDFIEDGTKPEPPSFMNFYLEPGTFTLVFPPYQVGPYVLGRVDLTIPTSEVAGLRSEFTQ